MVMIASSSTPITPDQSERIAVRFLMDEWNIPIEDQEWFSVLDCRWVGESWYVVEIEIEGLPDRWIFQVFDTGYCDPNYTFTSPIQATESDTGLSEMPTIIADVVQAERRFQRV